MGQDSPRSPLFTAMRRTPDLCTMYTLIPKVGEKKKVLYLKTEFNCHIICDRPIRNCMCMQYINNFYPRKKVGVLYRERFKIYINSLCDKSTFWEIAAVCSTKFVKWFLIKTTGVYKY